MDNVRRAEYAVGWPLFRGQRHTAVRVHDHGGFQQRPKPVQGIRISDKRGQAARRPGSGPVRVHVPRAP